MTNLQITQMLHGAKEFVLYVVDEVTFKARHLLDGERADGVGQTALDEFEDEAAASAARAQEPTNEDLRFEDGPTEEEELFVAAAGEQDIPVFEDDEERESLPAIRPSRDDLGDELARAMLTQASGGSAEDDPMDVDEAFDHIITPKPAD